jgi:hypothetical protein
VDKPLQLLKASSPIAVTLSGMETEVKSSQRKKTPFPIEVTPFSITVAFIESFHSSHGAFECSKFGISPVPLTVSVAKSFFEVLRKKVPYEKYIFKRK